MPASSSAGRAEALEMIMRIDPEPETILDVGAGAGQWLDLLLPWFPQAKYTAVEIFLPYIVRYRLRERYDEVQNCDISELRENYTASFDLAIFGDVLEHMSKPEAYEVVHGLEWKHALLSIPLGYCPQEPTEENPYEEHVSTWEPADVYANFPVKYSFVGDDPIKHAGLDIRRGVFLLERQP